MKKIIFVTAVSCLFLGACAPEAELAPTSTESSEIAGNNGDTSSEDTKQSDFATGETSAGKLSVGDNSRNALDWAGIYVGTIPGTNSDIKVTLTLSADSKYLMVSEYVDKGESFTSEGKFKWDDYGSIITLEGTENIQYKVGENQIIQLDKNGNEITGELAEKYVLLKTTVD